MREKKSDNFCGEIGIMNEIGVPQGSIFKPL